MRRHYHVNVEWVEPSPSCPDHHTASHAYLLSTTDEFVDLARGAQSKDSLTEALDERFPKVARSAAALQPLRNLFYSACPDHDWKVGDLPVEVCIQAHAQDLTTCVFL